MNQFWNSKLNTLGYVRNYHSDFGSSNIINHTLYHKYASSQNYYFTKEINDILSKNRTPATIKFYDDIQYLENEECMSRVYDIDDYQSKIQLLVEFYKYHHDLPRFTVEEEIIQILNLYYDKKRKLEFYKIQRQIEYENQKNPDKPQKGIVGDQPIESQSTPQSDINGDSTINNNVENILQDVLIQQKNQNQISQQDISQITKFQDDQKSEIQQMLDIFNQGNQKNIQKYSFQKNSSPSFNQLHKLNEQMLTQSNQKQYTLYQQNVRIPLTTRHPSSSLSRNLKTSSHEKKLDNNFAYLFNKCPQRKRQTMENKNEIKKEFKKSVPNIKSLGLRILACLNQIEKYKQNTKCISSLDNKEIQKIIFSVHSPAYSSNMNPYKGSSTHSIKISQQVNTQDDYVINQSPINFHTTQTPRSNQDGSKLVKRHFLEQKQKDNLKKLMVYKKDNNIKTQKDLRLIPKLNLNRVNNLNVNSCCNTLRINGLNQNSTNQLTPKSFTFRSRINNIINQQIKTIQNNYVKNSVKQ
ncbi:unnamed protein product (macronuclear) [Paramecium tetraurelia]|uniref:Uncharacterized protein n=1 Tax=Paramecium tetraurelia TaxID=5888 RepID=A0E698_PARTE|nr:uncharacterized protein GSPATT00003680001 [Paramecium tetraurelia]CAK90815.1 unnamed protein product [Paramecium tetraurelia]|eukprot:XP_001458212.1 hypothetical protein (macronuclear) [Paramecium tetraurelia strain d4-2]